MSNLSVTPEERVYLRELAKQCQEYASLPVMAERRKLWYEHNALQAVRPVLVMELGTFSKDILPPLKCTSAIAREIEAEFQARIVNHELIDDDKVMPDDYTVPWQIDFRMFDLEVKLHRAEDSEGRSVGYQFEYDITDLRRDIEKLRPSVFSVDRDGTFAKKAFIESLIGDILPVNIKNKSMEWVFGITGRVIMLMGMENMFMSLMDSPEEMVRLLTMIRDSLLDGRLISRLHAGLEFGIRHKRITCLHQVSLGLGKLAALHCGIQLGIPHLQLGSLERILCDSERIGQQGIIIESTG